jgi:hypothetical protein
LLQVTVVGYPTISCGTVPYVMTPAVTDDTLQGVFGGMIGVQSKSIFQKAKDSITAIFSGNNTGFFPNPVAPGGIMHVRFDVKNMNKYELVILNSAGQVLSVEIIDVQVKNQVKQIFIPVTFTKGIYFLRANSGEKEM